MPKRERMYGHKKTTIPEGKKQYQLEYMRDYRRRKKAEKEKKELERKRLHDENKHLKIEIEDQKAKQIQEEMTSSLDRAVTMNGISVKQQKITVTYEKNK